MAIRLGVIMDPIEKINVMKDSTLAMLKAAESKGWEVHYMQQHDLFVDANKAMAVTRRLTQLSYDANSWYHASGCETVALSTFDVLLMRKDPPFDNEYIYSTYLLEMAEEEGVLVVNKPASLRDCNEKIFATRFHECSPPVMVSRRPDLLRSFLNQHGDIIMKPLDGMGGASVFRVRAADPNISVIIETLTQHGHTMIMAQRYIPEIKQGISAY